MIPFNRALPYDIFTKDVYIPACPFCGQEQVLIPIKPAEIQAAHEGKKKLVVFPCCHNKLFVTDSDQDYLMTDTIVKR